MIGPMAVDPRDSIIVLFLLLLLLLIERSSLHGGVTRDDATLQYLPVHCPLKRQGAC